MKLIRIDKDDVFERFANALTVAGVNGQLSQKDNGEYLFEVGHENSNKYANTIYSIQKKFNIDCNVCSYTLNRPSKTKTINNGMKK